MQFSPKGGNEMAQVSSDDAKSTPHLTNSEQSPAKRVCEEKGRRREHNGVFTVRWKRNGANFFTPPSSEQSPAKRVCEEKGRRREHNGVFTARWKRNGANFF